MKTNTICIALIAAILVVFTAGSASADLDFLEIKLIASDGEAGEQFGRSVSIDGDTVIVGAPNDADAGFHTGSAYIFQDTSAAGDWSSFTETKLTASDASADDYFGQSVAIDGDTAIIGAYKDDVAGYRSGSAYIFLDTSAAGDWTSVTETKLTPGGGASDDNFGLDVSIDGDTAIVGASGTDDVGSASGSAYIFQDTSAAGDWSSFTKTKLTASDAAMHDHFGVSVSIDGGTIIVGASYGPGSAYIFLDTSAAGDWSSITETKLTASDAEANDYFGHRVAIDGGTAIVGAIGRTSVYMFQDTSAAGDWSSFIETVLIHGPWCVSIDGDTAIVANGGWWQGPGCAYILQDTSAAGDWSSFTKTKLMPSNSGGLNFFGSSVSIDGGTAIVGAHGEFHGKGAAYVYVFADICPNDPDNDIDGDGICGDVDNCPETANPDQADDDADGIGDVCDDCPYDSENDIDEDGWCGDIDNCPYDFNDNQLDSDSDGIGNVCDACPFDPDNDIDGDGVCGDEDNCPLVPNPGQEVCDDDGLGNACDLDDDDDGLADEQEAGEGTDTCNPDTDGDGILDGPDQCKLEDASGFDADLNGCIDTPDGLIDIINTIPDDVLSDETKNSLIPKCEAAERSIDKEKDTAAINQLGAFINEVNAQRGKKISEEAADLLIQYALNIIAQIEAG